MIKTILTAISGGGELWGGEIIGKKLLTENM